MIECVIVYPFPVDSFSLKLPMVLKKKPDYLVGYLNLPGGKLNPGEDPIAGAIRELKEETGLDDIESYDGMCYYPCEYMGIIEGIKCIIHCIKVPVCSRQELNPGQDETEKIEWYDFPELLKLPNLIPNLRLIIPLIYKNIKGWKIKDLDFNWKNGSSILNFSFDGIEDYPLQITV